MRIFEAQSTSVKGDFRQAVGLKPFANTAPRPVDAVLRPFDSILNTNPVETT